jgi:hypothetical protein
MIERGLKKKLEPLTVRAGPAECFNDGEDPGPDAGDGTLARESRHRRAASSSTPGRVRDMRDMRHPRPTSATHVHA